LSDRFKIGLVLRFKNPARWKIEWESLYADHLTYAAAADRLGFDGLWVTEHHCVPSGYDPAPLVALGALAVVTRRCRIGTQPLLLPLYNPVLLAEQACAVDVLSRGRLILCLGAGYRVGDFEAVGIPRAERGGRSEEALGVLLRALRGESFDYDGQFFKLRGVSVAPPPSQARVPVQLAARSAPAVRRAIRHGVDVNVHAVETAVELAPIFQEEAAKANRSLGDIGVSVQQEGYLGRNREEALTLSKPYRLWQAREAREFHGNVADGAADAASASRRISAIEAGEGGAFTADEWVEAIHSSARAIAGAGMRPDWVNLTLWHSGMPVEQALDALEQFAAEVMPRVRAG
jgi:alkanesulfonate monooxygenase SsuD/methylene tetrahydromethanopterin reductase-like flavin-dependent oxidoreductase (luciferase family)